jgi:hypothetical protein
MRQSLSDSRPEARATTAAVVLSVVLMAAAIIDQVGGRGLAEHAAAMYAPVGKQPAPGLLYGLVYTVAVVEVVLWFVVHRVVRARRRFASGLTVSVVVVTAALAAALLASTEYGARIFPSLWGVLAVLPAAAGIAAVVLLRRVRQGR